MHVLTLIPWQYTLPEHNIPYGAVDGVNSRLAGVKHETVGKLHRLGTGSAKLFRDNNFTALGTGLHNERRTPQHAPTTLSHRPEDV